MNASEIVAVKLNPKNEPEDKTADPCNAAQTQMKSGNWIIKIPNCKNG